MKLVAETVGDFMLWSGVETLEAERPGVVVSEGFWDMKISQGQVKVHGRVTDDVTDADLQEHMAKAMPKDAKEHSDESYRSALDAFVKQHEWQEGTASTAIKPSEPTDPQPNAPTPDADNGTFGSNSTESKKKK